MDLWYDLTTFIHLAFVGGSNAGYVVTVVLYSMFVPLDMFNLFIRTGYCLEDIPARSHLFNLIFEVPMLLFNIYVMATCAPLLHCMVVCLRPACLCAALGFDIRQGDREPRMRCVHEAVNTACQKASDLSGKGQAWQGLCRLAGSSRAKTRSVVTSPSPPPRAPSAPPFCSGSSSRR